MFEKTFVEQMRSRLEQEKKNLEKELENFAKKDRSLKGDWDTFFPNFKGGSLEEEADEVEEYGNLLPIERALETRLTQINTALEKIKGGQYGICKICNKEIGRERLEAIPEAAICRKCKS
ncbi:MAG: TraR/DksA C4-type zinc finger protein [bacterium]|nr:TraR/DksA C4-type zinc finger protein [bacterium]